MFVTGRVPDVRPYVAHATAAVAPMRIARGIQNKVLEAMAMGKPVVLTSGALEGIEAEPGTEVILADTAEDVCRRPAAGWRQVPTGWRSAPRPAPASCATTTGPLGCAGSTTCCALGWLTA